MVKVITYGTYDLLHYGHIRLLERAKALGDYLIVGITSDDYDKARGKINNQQSLIDRIAAVEATGLADKIVVEEYEGQKIDDIRRFGVDIFTVGSDWEGYFDYLNEYCKVIYLQRTDGISSTEIRAEQRRIRIGIIGNLGIKRKFINEVQHVNGVELVEADSDLTNVDAVYIASKPEMHYKDVKNALLKNKDVLCESPIAISESQCKELQRYAKENGLILADAVKTAYATAFSRLLVIAKSGRIGDIVSVDAVCTSLQGMNNLSHEILQEKQNSICAWGPTALLPVFQLLGTNYKDFKITTKIIDKELMFDGFTKIDFTYDKAVASVKIGKAAKAEGELIITGTKGYIYVPAPWWKTDYFEVRYENPAENRRCFYQLDGDGIRYEIVAFIKAINGQYANFCISDDISAAICTMMEHFYAGNVTYIGAGV